MSWPYQSVILLHSFRVSANHDTSSVPHHSPAPLLLLLIGLEQSGFMTGLWLTWWGIVDLGQNLLKNSSVMFSSHMTPCESHDWLSWCFCPGLNHCLTVKLKHERVRDVTWSWSCSQPKLPTESNQSHKRVYSESKHSIQSQNIRFRVSWTSQWNHRVSLESVGELTTFMLGFLVHTLVFTSQAIQTEPKNTPGSDSHCTCQNALSVFFFYVPCNNLEMSQFPQ